MKLKNFFICVAIFALILATPVFAADDNEGDDDGDDTSFYIMLEGAATTANGGGGLYTLMGEDIGVPFGMTRSAEMDAAFAPRVSFGWKVGDGWLALSWSQWDDDILDSVSAATPDTLWDTLYHADDAWDNFEGTASAMRNIDATTIDLTYGRKTFGNDKFSGRWMFGLRQASLDQMMNVEYNDLINLHLVDLTSEASGIGFMGGVSGTYNINKKWFVTAGFEYSFLTGEVESNTTMIDTDIAGTFLDIDADVTMEEDRMFSMFGASSSLVWHPADAWYVWFGYEFTQWNDVVDTMLFPDDVSEGFIQVDTTDVSFDGFHVGVGFTF